MIPGIPQRNVPQMGKVDTEKPTYLFIRLQNKTEAPKSNWVTATYDDLDYAKSGADYCKRKYGEDCIIMDQSFAVIYDTRV